MRFSTEAEVHCDLHAMSDQMAAIVFERSWNEGFDLSCCPGCAGRIYEHLTAEGQIARAS